MTFFLKGMRRALPPSVLAFARALAFAALVLAQVASGRELIIQNFNEQEEVNPNGTIDVT